MTTGLVTRFRDAAQGPAHRWWVLAAVECGNFVVYMDGFIVTLALPAMARQFGVGIHEIKWVLVAYLAAVTVTLLLAGHLADRWGRKPVTVVGVALLTLGAALCALAPTLTALIAFRVLQGLGGALVLANVMAEITAVFPREERRRAMAINASVLAMGQVTGLLLGGFLIDRLGWRSIFVVILAVGGLGFVMDLAVLRSRATGPGAPMDRWGGVLSVLIVGVPFLLIERLSRDLLDPVGLAFLLAGLVLIGLFVEVERRSAWPLLDLRLLRLRAFTCGAIAAAFYFIVATFGYFLMPLYAQVVLGLSPFFAGLLIVPLSVALTVSSQLVGRMAGRFSARIVSTAGLICVSAGVFGMSLLGHECLLPLHRRPLGARRGRRRVVPPAQQQLRAERRAAPGPRRGQRILHDGPQLRPGYRGRAGGGDPRAGVGTLRSSGSTGPRPRRVGRRPLLGRLRPCPGLRIPGRRLSGTGGRRDFRAARQ